MVSTEHTIISKTGTVNGKQGYDWFDPSDLETRNPSAILYVDRNGHTIGMAHVEQSFILEEWDAQLIYELTGTPADKIPVYMLDEDKGFLPILICRIRHDSLEKVLDMIVNSGE